MTPLSGRTAAVIHGLPSNTCKCTHQLRGQDQLDRQLMPSVSELGQLELHCSVQCPSRWLPPTGT
eukprot:335554-Chlamydomonas_euryale.AAC.4